MGICGQFLQAGGDPNNMCHRVNQSRTNGAGPFGDYLCGNIFQTIFSDSWKIFDNFVELFRFTRSTCEKRTPIHENSRS